jgi:hypothetical protein
MRYNTPQRPIQPAHEIGDPPKGTVKETVFWFAKKHGHSCTIKGEVYGGTLKSRAKARRKWEITAAYWFIHTPISEVIKEPFVVFEYDEKDAQRMKTSPIFKAFDNGRLQTEFDAMTNQD